MIDPLTEAEAIIRAFLLETQTDRHAFNAARKAAREWLRKREEERARG